MRDYIVTHAGLTTDRFYPRVIRCDEPKEAIYATVRALRWHHRSVRVSYSKTTTAFGTQDWICRGKRFTDVLHVEPFRPSDWAWCDDIVRLDKQGRYIKHLRHTDLARAVRTR